MRYKREELETLFDSVEEIRFFSDQIKTKIKTDYFSDSDYDLLVELRKINENWQRIKRFLPDNLAEQKVSKEEEHKSIIETLEILQTHDLKK